MKDNLARAYALCDRYRGRTMKAKHARRWKHWTGLHARACEKLEVKP